MFNYKTTSFYQYRLTSRHYIMELPPFPSDLCQIGAGSSPDLPQNYIFLEQLSSRAKPVGAHSLLRLWGERFYPLLTALCPLAIVTHAQPSITAPQHTWNEVWLRKLPWAQTWQMGNGRDITGHRLGLGMIFCWDGEPEVLFGIITCVTYIGVCVCVCVCVCVGEGGRVG